jgi:hypothetical protein
MRNSNIKLPGKTFPFPSTFTFSGRLEQKLQNLHPRKAQLYFHTVRPYKGSFSHEADNKVVLWIREKLGYLL